MPILYDFEYTYCIYDGKEHKDFDGVTYILERGIVADIGLVHAHTADQAGNLVYRNTARNFNPLVAQCGQFTVAEAEVILNGYVEPNLVITPGIFIQGLVQATPRQKPSAEPGKSRRGQRLIGLVPFRIRDRDMRNPIGRHHAQARHSP